MVTAGSESPRTFCTASKSKWWAPVLVGSAVEDACGGAAEIVGSHVTQASPAGATERDSVNEDDHTRCG
jgi:hypothetical protein